MPRTADALWNELSVQLTPLSAVALDCVGITFMDSIGLQTVMRAHRHTAEQQAFFALIGFNAYVDRVLELTGMTEVVARFADVRMSARPPSARAYAPCRCSSSTLF
ncbi:WecB/TagA/CpsF family glycosyl transferase [Catenulispora acidiphila DSM 44928]|uniref:WecB/TagA/CpsF family glycosyl transferase n=1 Tax=Catenulispora acidiphila (strain DSM 44928 / JCM 14897 / NBRC 102108 / NRRL B-24433 / ID139908) TaxID=479433 RepID=C7QEV0_CATAD|nr:WecB/TagA/CpsF family glycosyl transferase [Catenulispora acidiphila DSM 44928]